jgi:nucleoid-associated protein YgaU
MKTQVVQYIRDRQSTLASGLAALLIIVAGFLVFNYFSGLNKTKAPSIPPESSQTSQLNGNPTLPVNTGQPTQAPASLGTSTLQLPTTYTVVRGDSLSAIAQKYYGDASKWTEIAKANNLANPQVIHAGNALTVPQLASSTQASAAQTASSGASVGGTSAVSSKIGNTYTVRLGDTLWSIAQKAYGSGYEWYRIDQANAPIPRNALGKPLISPGQNLKIP